MSPCAKTCKKYIKRLFLIFLPTPAIVFVPSWDWSRSIYYVTASVILSTASILLNFPKIIHFLHGKSVGYEDLKDENAVDTYMKRRFQRAFEITITITLAILMGALIDYYLDRYQNTELSNLEILGVMGGFMSLLYKIEDFIGKILLVGLHRYKVEFSPRLSFIISTNNTPTGSQSSLISPPMPDLELGPSSINTDIKTFGYFMTDGSEKADV